MRRHRDVLATPGALPSAVAALAGRLPAAVTGLALLFLLSAHTPTWGGLAAGAYAAGTAVTAGWLGRLADRHPGGVLVVCGLAHAVALSAAVAAALCGRPAVTCCLAAVAGGASPPTDAVLRALWARLFPRTGELRVAYALDTVVVEAAFLAGPALLAGLGARTGRAVPVLACAALSLVGAAALAGVGRGGGTSGRPGGGCRPGRAEAGGRRRSPLAEPALRTAAGATLLFGLGNGLVEVAVASFPAAGAGTTATADPRSAVALAAMAAGSVTGGLGYACRDWPGGAGRRFAVLQFLLAGGLALCALATGRASLALLLFLAGLFVAPVAAENAVLVTALTAPDTRAEAFGWLLTAVTAGGAAGNALGGWCTAWTGPHTLLVLAGAALAAAGAAAAAHPRLRRVGGGERPP